MTEEHTSKVGLARSVGRFWGHLRKGVSADVGEGGAVRREVRRETEEREGVETPYGLATLRRTVIEEIELKDRRDIGDGGDGMNKSAGTAERGSDDQ